MFFKHLFTVAQLLKEQVIVSYMYLALIIITVGVVTLLHNRGSGERCVLITANPIDADLIHFSMLDALHALEHLRPFLLLLCEKVYFLVNNLLTLVGL